MYTYYDKRRLLIVTYTSHGDVFFSCLGDDISRYYDYLIVSIVVIVMTIMYSVLITDWLTCLGVKNHINCKST